MERKLVSIRTIEKIIPIDGADRIEIAAIGAWHIIVPKGVYKEKDKVLYFEIDSFIPDNNKILAPFIDEDMKKRAHKTFYKNDGVLIKTIKLRGEYSQGWVLPLEHFKDYNFVEGKDLSTELGVLKYELVDETSNMEQKGKFPTFFPKTDCERIQNLTLSDLEKIIEEKVEITYKFDGTSFSNYYFNGETGICTRNFEMKPEVVNLYTKSAITEKIRDYCEKNKRNLAFQGEIVGPEIQKNRMSLTKQQLFIFNIYDIDAHRYIEPNQRIAICGELGLSHVEIYEGNLLKNGKTLIEQIDICPEDFKKMSIEEKTEVLEQLREKILKMTETICSKTREGFVFKSFDGKMIIKAISNKYIS